MTVLGAVMTGVAIHAGKKIATKAIAAAADTAVTSAVVAAAAKIESTPAYQEHYRHSREYRNTLKQEQKDLARERARKERHYQRELQQEQKNHEKQIQQDIKLAKANKVRLDFGAEYFKGKPYTTATNYFKQEGFTNIITRPIHSLLASQGNNRDIVQKIFINRKPDFKENEVYKLSSEVIIDYLEYKQIRIGIDNFYIIQRGMTVDKIDAYLRSRGFSNIHRKTEETYDNPRIELTVNGNSAFAKNEAYIIDANIEIISYVFHQQPQQTSYNYYAQPEAPIHITPTPSQGQTSEKHFCTQCGSKILFSDQAFCDVCGNKL